MGVMNKVKKPNIRNILLLLLVISMIYNFSMYIKYNHFIDQLQRQNQSSLWSISVSGENLAERLEEFLNHSHESDNEEIQEILYNSWRVVQGESRSNHFDLGRMNPYYMKDSASKWSLLQYSLIRIDELLYGLNIDFLEQGSYSINNEETEQLKAVISVYRKIYEEVKSESDHPELVIDALTEEMKIIDLYYSQTLERVESN